MSTKSSSSMEQGELEASPEDFRHDFLPSLSLNLDMYSNSSSQHVNDLDKDNSPDTNGEDEDGLQIQPPQIVQLPVSKREKRDRKDKHSSRRHHPDTHRISDNSIKDKHSKHSRSTEDDLKEKEDSRKEKSNTRELDKELKRRLERQKREELEQIRRKKSLQERERLEKLERERRRKEIELQREIDRIQDQKKLERQSRHVKTSDGKDRKDGHQKSRDSHGKKRKHSKSPVSSKRDYNNLKLKEKEKKEKRHIQNERLAKYDVSRSENIKDLMKLELSNQKSGHSSSENNSLKAHSSYKNDDEYSNGNTKQRFWVEENNHINTNETNEDADDDDDDDDMKSSSEDNFMSPTNTNEIFKPSLNNSPASEAETFNPLTLKSKFDDPSDSEEEVNSKSIKSESIQSSALPSPLAYELDPSPIPSPPELALPAYYPALQGCRNVEEFHCLNRIEEGTYGVVYRAVDIKTEEIVALKRLKMEKEKEGFPITSLREINTLLKAQHINIVTVREIVVGSNMDKIYIVMDYVEHDLKSLMEYMKEPFIIGEVKTLMQQLLSGVNHLHDNWIIHRDLKTSNLLLSHKGILKIGDFGLAREYGNPLKAYTPIVVTLWYRAPELLLGTKEYSTPIDLWSVGCIYAEFLTKKPLFPGKSEIDELNRIFKELGTPNEKIWPGVNELPAMKKCSFTEYPYNQLRQRFGSTLSDLGFDLMNKLLTYDPSKRSTAEDALRHDFFKESPQPVLPSMFPTWPARSEQCRESRNKHASSPKPPSGGKAYAKLLGEDDDQVPGFHLNTINNQPVTNKGAGFALKF